MSDRHTEELQAAVRDGDRVAEFLDDAAVVRAFERCEAQFLAEFRAAETDEQRRGVWAKTKALDALRVALRGTNDRGQAARAELGRNTAARPANRR